MNDNDPLTPLRIGILSLHNSKETKAIANAVEDLGHRPVWLRAENMTGRIQDGAVHLDPAVDVLANRLLLTKSDRPLEELGLAQAVGADCPVLNAPTAVMGAMHKYGAAAQLAAAEVPVPDAFLGLDGDTLQAGLSEFEDRAVHKALIGTNGSHMTRVTEGPIGARVGRRRAFLQEFVSPTDDRPSDLRMYVVGGEVIGAMRRHAPENEWRTNVAVGGRVEDATDSLDKTAVETALDAVETLGLDYAGVDLLDDGDWTVLEVNATAGFKGFYEATGISPAPYIAALAIERGGASVDGSAVERIATELDDSIPECKPATDRDDEGGVVGFTETVAIAGTEGTKEVVAKADTGATRTSIDAELAATVGAGPLVGTVEVKSANSDTRRRTLVEIEVRLDGTWRTVEASIEDRGHLSRDVLLGRDILTGYRVDVDRRVDEGVSPDSPGVSTVTDSPMGAATDGGTEE